MTSNNIGYMELGFKLWILATIEKSFFHFFTFSWFQRLWPMNFGLFSHIFWDHFWVTTRAHMTHSLKSQKTRLSHEILYRMTCRLARFDKNSKKVLCHQGVLRSQFSSIYVKTPKNCNFQIFTKNRFFEKFLIFGEN